MTLRASMTLCLTLASCGGGVAPGPVALFAPTAVAGSADLSSLPWPNDLFLDAGGHIAIASLAPLQKTALHQALLADLGRHDGFAVSTGAFFPVSAPIDPATVDGNLILLDLEDAAAVPLVTGFRAEELLIHARPQNGHVLLQRHRYAYFVVEGVKGSDGNPLRAAPDWSAVRDAAARPADPRLGRAWDVIHPALDALGRASPPIAKSRVVAAAVFTTQSVTADLEAIHAAVLALPPPTVRVAYLFAAAKMPGDDATLDAILGKPASLRPGTDNPGGIAHDAIGYLVQGTFDAPDWLAATAPSADPKLGTVTLSGALIHGSDGKPMPQGIGSVPFTLVLPAAPTSGSYADVPTVIFTHGLGGERGATLAVANTLARGGFAAIGLDLPFHGLRESKAVDVKHNFGGGAGPDGFADGPSIAENAFFNVAGDAKRGIAALDPAVIRGAFQQSVSDLFGEVRLVTAGSLAPVAARDPRLSGLSLRQDSVVYSGESFGSIIGGIAIAVEPKVGAAVLDVGGGGLIFPLLTWSVDFGPIFGVLLDGALGTYPSTDPPETELGYNLIEFLLEAGDPLAYAPYVIRHPLAGSAPRHVVMLNAYLDEAVPNIANQALAGAMGLQPSRVSAGGAPNFDYTTPPPTVIPAPLAGNLMVGGKPVTGAIVLMRPATHGMFTNQVGRRTHDASARPFVMLPQAESVQNPIDALHAIYLQFVTDYFAGRVPTLPDAK